MSSQGTVTFTEDLENAVRNARFIFEAVFEDLNVKQDLFESRLIIYEINSSISPTMFWCKSVLQTEESFISETVTYLQMLFFAT